MEHKVLAAYDGRKAHVYWRDFPQSIWVDFSESQQNCKLMIFDKQGEHFVKITTEDDPRKFFEYLIPRDVQVIYTEGMFQFPVRDPLDASGGKLIGLHSSPNIYTAAMFIMDAGRKLRGFSKLGVSGFHPVQLPSRYSAEDEVIAAYYGSKARAYWRNFPQSRWVDFLESQQKCKLIIFDRQGDHFVKITAEDNPRKIFEYLIPRDVLVIDIEGMFLFPVRDPWDASGGKLIGLHFSPNATANTFLMKLVES